MKLHSTILVYYLLSIADYKKLQSPLFFESVVANLQPPTSWSSDNLPVLPFTIVYHEFLMEAN